MRKTYILDTSVFIHDPNSFKSFHGNDVIIPVSVLGELDKLKTFPNEAGKNARVSVRMLDELTKNGDIIKGIKIDNDILVKIDASVSTDEFGDPSYADNQILWCAYSNRQNKRNKKSPTVLVSKDINLRVRARALSILAEDYEADKSTAHELYVGYKTVVNDEMGTDIFTNELIDCSKYEELENLFPNECVHIESSDGRGIALAKKVGDKLKLIKSQKPWGLASRNKEQAMAIDLIMDKSIPLVSLIGSAGTGKAQPLDADVLTPDGFKKMGSLKVGDLVSTPDGKSAPIVGIFPQGEKDIYKVSFSDGTSTECCEDHLWLTKTSRERRGKRNGSVRDTKEIISTLTYGKDGRKNHTIPITSAIQFIKKNLSVKPYSFGISLVESSFSGAIPDAYKYSSISDRIELLQGILDAGGTVNKSGMIQYCTSSQKLTEDFRWIVESLGGTGKIKVENGLHKMTVAMPREIAPFKSQEKLSKISDKEFLARRYVVGVDLVGKKQAQCIMIDHPDHLYLTNNFIVTHNTLCAVAAALEMVLEKKMYQKLIVYRPIHTVGKDLGYLPGDLAEKLAPQVVALNDTFEFLFSSQKGDKWKLMLEMYKEKGIIEIGALAYVRGRSIPNSLIICDETQNLSRQEVKTLLSRLSDGSKAILIGDIEQIDNSSLDAMDNGLTRAVETFKTSRLAAHVTLTKGERSELATEAAKLL